MPKLNPKFAKLAGKIITEDARGGLLPQSVKEIQMVAERAQDLSGGGGGTESASTVGTVCTADTISTVSSVCLADGLTTLATSDPELSQAITTLHDRAVKELGVDAMAETMVRFSK